MNASLTIARFWKRLCQPALLASKEKPINLRGRLFLGGSPMHNLLGASAKSAINLDNGGAESVGTARPGQVPQHPEASVLGNLTT